MVTYPMARAQDDPQELPELEETVQTEQAVHLIFRVTRDWDTQREQAVAEVERKIAALTEYAGSPAFAARHGARLGVLRLRTPRQPPSIVTTVLGERGVEVDAPDAEGQRAGPGQTCASCGRQGLSEAQASMTDAGWACPSCFRAWTRLREKSGPQPLRVPSLSFISTRVRIALFLVFIALCVLGAGYELMRLGQVDRAIRGTVPQE